MDGGYLNFIKHFCRECLTEQGKKKIIDLERQVNLGEITEKQFYRQIEKTFHVAMTPKQMHNSIVNRMRANKSLIKFLPELKKEKTALFTNSIGHMALDVLKMRRVPTNKIFDKVFVSSKIHMAKPDPKAYKFAMAKLKVKPSETILVDDRLENIKPALALGMHGIIFKNTSQFKKELTKYNLV